MSLIYEAANIDAPPDSRNSGESPSPMLSADVKFYGCELHHRLLPGIRPGIHHDEGRTFIKTQTLVQLIYSMAFDSFNMGYASTIAVALFIITFIISVFTFKHMTKGEEDLG